MNRNLFDSMTTTKLHFVVGNLCGYVMTQLDHVSRTETRLEPNRSSRTEA